MHPLELLKQYSGKRRVTLTHRGNNAILLALKIAKAQGCDKVVVQDQGGWITYSQYPEKLKMRLVTLPTDFGLIPPDALSKQLDGKSVLLVNSLSGYFAEQPMALLSSVCKLKGALLINDATGSLGTELAKFGDIIVASFGEDKPVGLGTGGMLAFSDLDVEQALLDSAHFDESRMEDLGKALRLLPSRLRKLDLVHQRVKKDLAEMDILHRESRGINVVVRCSGAQKERVINYCLKRHLEYTECPRSIRANVEGVSIEVKRLDTGKETRLSA